MFSRRKKKSASAAEQKSRAADADHQQSGSTHDLQIDLRGIQAESDNPSNQAQQANDYNTSPYENYDGNNDQYYGDEQYNEDNGQYDENGQYNEYDGQYDEEYNANMNQMFMVVSKNMILYKDADLQIEDKENMLIEQNSTVMGQYMNDYVIYIDEPYYVYVSVEDLQEIDASKVDGYNLDTGDENSQKDKPAALASGSLASTSVAGGRSANLNAPSHISHAASDSYDDSYNEDDSKHGLDTSNLSGILSHVPSQSMDKTPSAGASGKSPSHLNYNSAEIQLPQQNEEKATGSYLISLDDAIATNMSSGMGPNGRSSRSRQRNDNRRIHNNSPNPQARDNRSRSSNGMARGDNLSTNPMMVRASSHSQSHSQRGGRRSNNNSDLARVRKQHELQYQMSNSYTNNQPSPISQHSQNSPLVNRNSSIGMGNVGAVAGRRSRSHSRSQSQSSHRSHQSHQSHQSHHSHQGPMNTMGMNGTGTGTGTATGTNTNTGTGTNTTDSNGSPDYNNKDRDISPSNSRTHSRRGSVSSVSTFYNLRQNRRMAGDDGDSVSVVSGRRRGDGKSVHLIAKEQIKNPLYFNQIANEILAKRQTSAKDPSKTRDTITDNILVHKFNDARPRPGRRYFTQSRYLKDGISVLIPFRDEPAQQLEATLTELYYTYRYLTQESGNWCDKPFSVFLVQDGWSKAPKSLQNYLKKMFPKQFFFADANGAPVGGGVDDQSELNITSNYENYHGHGTPVRTPATHFTGNDSPNLGPLRPALNNQPSQSQSFDIKYNNDQSDPEMEIQYDEPRPSFGRHSSQRSLGSRGSRHQAQMSQQSISEYAQSVAMELPSESQFWWDYFEDFDGGYKPKQGPITYVFEKTVDNPTYFQLRFNRNDKGRYDKKIENQLTMHITLMIKLDTRGKHNSREWFLGRSGFAEAYRSRYLMMTNAFTLFDIKCLWALTNYLDRNPKCSVVTGRQRAMTRRQQGKKHTEFKCSMDYLLRLTQTFDWELTNNVYNPCYGALGFLPVVPGQCGLYRASDMLQDNARVWYFDHVNADPNVTGLVLGNLQHVEDRLLTYASTLKVEDYRRVGNVPEALFYIKVSTDIEEVIEDIRERIDGLWAGFIFILFTGKQNFWNWPCDQGHKLFVFGILVANFIQMCVMFFGTSISFSMIRSSLTYLISKYGEFSDERVTVVMLFVWLLYLVHLVIHNTTQFHNLIVKLLFMVSIATSLLTAFTYCMIILYDGTSIYDALFADFITEVQFSFVYYLIFFCLVAPFPCALIIGGLDSCALLIKSYGAYLFSFHLMWGWVSSYAMVRCWDIEFGENDHAVEAGNGGDPLNNERAEDRERMEARFLQRSRMVMLALLACNILGYMVPIICFVAIMFFLLSIGLFMCLSLLSAMTRSAGVDLHLGGGSNGTVVTSSRSSGGNTTTRKKTGRSWNCCTIPEGNSNDPGVGRSEEDRQRERQEQSVGTQSNDRREESNSDNELIIIPQTYIMETKERYDRMKHISPSPMGPRGSYRPPHPAIVQGQQISPQLQGQLQMVPVGSAAASRYSMSQGSQRGHQIRQHSGQF